MADNTTLIVVTPNTPGDTIRDIDRGGVKTQVMQLDAGGQSAESLVSPANPLPILTKKDTGRVYKTFWLDAVAGITTEVLATMNINSGGTVTTAASYTVTAGKTLRLMSMTSTIKDSTTTSVHGRVRVRSGSPVAVTSGILMDHALPNEPGTAVAGAGSALSTSFPDGIEIAAGQQIGISHIESSTSSLVSCCIVGFEY